jgi:hypothetical protein
MWLFYPPGFDKKKKYPVMHAIHGGPHTGPGDNWHYRWNYAALCAQGYVVAQRQLPRLVRLRPCLPGQHHPPLGRTGVAGRGGRHRLAAEAALGRQEARLRHRRQLRRLHGGLDERPCAAGRYAAYVCHAGCFDWTGMFADDAYAWHAKELGAWYWDDMARRCTHRARTPSAGRDADTPTLVIHGALDYRVPDAQGLAYYNTLKARGVDARLLWFPDENHWILKPRNSRLWYERVLRLAEGARPAPRKAAPQTPLRRGARQRACMPATVCGRSWRNVPRHRPSTASPSPRARTFFFTLRAAKLPVSVKEYLTLLEALKRRRDRPKSVDDFYYLARTTLVKDEAHFDKFDRAFGRLLQGRGDAHRLHPRTSRWSGCARRWRRSSAPRRRPIEKMGWDELMETLKKRLEEQKERHEGGSKWIGTGGTSPVRPRRLQPAGHPHRRQGAATAARSRSGTSAPTRTTTTPRNSARATSRSRCAGCAASPARAPRLELDLDDTIHAPRPTPAARHQDGARAPQQGEGAAADGRRRHDGRAHPPRRGTVLGRQASSSTSSSTTSTTASTTSCGRTTGAATAEKTPTWDVIRKYNKDYKLIFVGDATMSPYEILQPGGSVEYNNEEPGAEWLQR